MGNNQAYFEREESRLAFRTLPLLFLTILFPLDTRAQNVDSLVQVINHSQSYEAVKDARGKIPAYLRKVGLNTLDVIRQLKSRGITRSSAAESNVSKQFSTSLVQLDGNANIHLKVHLRQFDDTSIAKLKVHGVKVGNIDNKFKEAICWVPFDAVDSLAKDDNVECLANVIKPHFEALQYTTVGDQILSASAARSTFGVDGTNINIGVISNGAYNYQNAISAGYLKSSLFTDVLDNQYINDNIPRMTTRSTTKEQRCQK